MTIVDDIASLREKNKALEERTDDMQKILNRQDEQLNGERGISNALREQTAEIRGLRKAAYWLAALIVTSSVGFAFSVLMLIP